MPRLLWKQVLAIPFGLFLGAYSVSSQTSRPKPLTKPLDCPKGGCSLLGGPPETAGMRSGFVRLKPGEAVGWHTTGQHEETLVILDGAGSVLVEGQAALTLAAPAMAYIPPATRHTVQNTGTEVLEYVYVVAPVK